MQAGHFCHALLQMGWRVGPGCFLGVSEWVVDVSWVSQPTSHMLAVSPHLHGMPVTLMHATMTGFICYNLRTLFISVII